MRGTLLTLLFLLSVHLVSAQCMNFAKNVGKPNLGNYLHDGNYNATTLAEGEKAELFKTFFSGQKYRMAISKVEQLPNIHLRLLDKEGTVLFDNANHDYLLVWDFEVESTRMLVVEINVLEENAESEELIAGCVSVLFGIDSGKKKKR